MASNPQKPLFKASDYPDTVEPLPKLSDAQVAEIERLARDLGRRRIQMFQANSHGGETEKRECMNALSDAYQQLHNYLIGAKA